MVMNETRHAEDVLDLLPIAMTTTVAMTTVTRTTVTKTAGEVEVIDKDADPPVVESNRDVEETSENQR